MCGYFRKMFIGYGNMEINVEFSESSFGRMV